MQDKKFMPGASKSERLQVLQNSASKVEETSYQKSLNQEELATRREEHIDNCIKLGNLDDELNKIKDKFKEEMKPMSLANRVLLTELKTKQTTIKGVIYHLMNEADSTMETYDADGMLIAERRLRPDEKQAGLYSLPKAANDK